MPSLSGTVNALSAAFDVATACPIDWAVAYAESPTFGWVRKIGGGSQITLKNGANADHASGGWYSYYDCQFTGGDPISDWGSEWKYVLWGDDAIITFPADTNERVVRIYFFCDYDGSGQAMHINAHLSDSSAADWVPSNVSVGGSAEHGYIEITYSAASAGQTLTVTLTDVNTGSVKNTGILAAGIVSVTPTAPEGLSGTLDATEAGSDTAVIAAVALVQGSLDATESGIDTAAIEGSLAVISTGSLAATESGSDTATFAGVAPVSGALAATEAANDSSAVSGVVLVTGALDATETGSDTAAFASSTPVTTAYPGPAGRATKGKRRRVVIRERVYEVNERDIPALLEAELLDRAPPVTAEVVEGPKPPRKRGKKAPQPVKTVEQVQEAVEQIKARIEPDNAWLAQALEAVAYRVLERLQDEEESIMLLVA